MKKSILHISVLLLCFTFIGSGTFAQSNSLFNKIEKKVKQRKDKKVDKAIDKGLDDIEDGIDDGVKGDGKKSEEEVTQKETKNTESKEKVVISEIEVEQEPVTRAWSKYDFVPGDKIIFEDLLANEQNGEFPSKWDLTKGSAENASFGDMNVISFAQSHTDINPLMKTESYLTEVFTIEFDIYFYRKGNESYSVDLKGYKKLGIRADKVSIGDFKGAANNKLDGEGWRHIAIAFNKRALKVYMGEERLLNIPRITQPTAVSFSALSPYAKTGMPAMIRNIRMAEGGVKLYDRLMTDGKIITHGIRFEVNKSAIKPESGGTLKEIIKIMTDNPELNFSVEGHTDSDGSDANNQKLSEERAIAVMNYLVDAGLAKNRFKTAGHGESKPMDTNGTSEGKANNRRVEFVKF